jgi:biotin carboxyl carrier protein
MKVTVKIEDRFFEVEVVNLHTRPIIATVEGEQFEVWPENVFVTRPPDAAPTAQPASTAAPAVFAAAPTAAPTAARDDVKAVYAPIPGVIVSVDVRAGDVVEVGQPLCVLEAMKMKNVIRSPRAGEITRVNVSAGDHVKHHDLLFEFTNC